jgi:hypothetical protein
MSLVVLFLLGILTLFSSFYLSSQTNTFADDIDSLNNNVDSLNTNVNSLNTDVDSLNTEVDYLSGNVDSLNSDVTNLETTTTGMSYNGDTNFNKKTIISDPNEFFIGSMNVKQEITNLNSKNTSYTDDINSLKQTTTGISYNGNTNFNQKTIISDPNEFFIGSLNVKKEIDDINTYIHTGLLTTTDLILDTLKSTSVDTETINGISKLTLSTVDTTSSIQSQLNDKGSLIGNNGWTGENIFNGNGKNSFGNYGYNPEAISDSKIINGMAAGTGDGHSYETFNNSIISWNTTGFIDTCFKACNAFISHRTGDIYTKGIVNSNSTVTNKITSVNGTIDNLGTNNIESLNVTTVNLFCTNSTSVNSTSTSATVDNLTSTSATVDNLTSTSATAEILASTNATINNLTSTNTTVDNLTSTNSTIENLSSSKASFSGARIYQSTAGWMLDGGDSQYNTPYPVLSSTKYFRINLSIADDKWIVNPGYKFILYKQNSYTDATQTIDNTDGYLPRYAKSIVSNSCKSIKVYFLNKEVNGMDD